MTWEYIAGFVDGEGSIVVNDSTDYRIVIPQTHLGVLEEIKLFANMGYIYECKKRQAHWKDAWGLAVARQKDVLYFLEKIEPYLIVKKHLAQKYIPLLRRIVEDRNSKKENLLKIIKTCKVLRSQGWTYRALGKKFNRDHGYIRRLILKK